MSRSKVSTATEKAGWLQWRSESDRFERVYVYLRNFSLSIFPDKNIKEHEPRVKVDMKHATVGPLEPGRSSRRHAFEVVARTASGAEAQRLTFVGESRDDQEGWLMYLAAAAVPPEWPGGLGPDRRPKPFLYSRVERAAAAAAREVLKAGGSTEEAAEARERRERELAPVERLPALKSVEVWRQRALLLRKLRLCSVVFDIPDGPPGGVLPEGEAPEASAGAAAVAAGAGGPLVHVPGAAGPGTILTRTSLEAREQKRDTLVELVQYCEAVRSAFGDFRVLDDAFNMLRCNLFRALPTAPEPSGDPDEEEEPFMDPQWPHLAVAYELLLHLVSLDDIEVQVKKKAIDASFVRQLLTLFDSEDMRERDYLKTITHRIYSKLTQRRALIRRVICHIFFEFVYETQRHNGVAEMLEILASIINGFAVPIKEEHKVMLSRALLPLHKPAGVMAYHPQLSYCMALYVAKDHTLTREIIPGLLRCWPNGSSNKQIMFLNELDDVFEYVQVDDIQYFRKPLAQRLRRALGGLHFQVAERSLCLWRSDRFMSLVLEDPPTRAEMLPILFPALQRNADSHWNDGVRTLSAHILEQYAETDADLYHICQDRAAREARSEASDEWGGLGPIARRPAQNEREALLADGRVVLEEVDPTAMMEGGDRPGGDGWA